MAHPLRISRLSTEYVQLPVSATEAGETIDPTASPVAMAFSPSADPTPDTFVAATWETAPGAPPTHFARCLVGPAGAATLDPGLYNVFIRITDNPEVPVISAGQILVY